ncbi:MAG: class I SAM-dependent methyltransferase [Proteobacteria bacterium]|nr:class I SAM-dependent methyltransferase [Pseudomonadota bacterium]MDA1057874.1 class I SAM-dependent methyltransferase [Pseudomonadota bacterium]
MSLRRFWLGLSTVTGLGARGFFIPHRYAGAIATSQPIYAEIAKLLAAHETAFQQTLRLIDEVVDDITSFSGPPPAPRWTQDWFPRADGAAAYAMVRHHRPARLIEVGSGHSTRFIAQAIADGGLSCAVTAIDPAPRAAIDALPINVIRQPVQLVPGDLFGQLIAGDVLFIDSSHILMPGTDVDHLFSRVLPRLPAGVFVHIHDVFLPDDYPAAWRWRGYNEQLAVAALLQGGRFAPLWASHYVITRMKDAVADSVLAGLPLPNGAIESSLWLRTV